MDKIDFVILWVDGNDEEWQREKSLYKPQVGTDTRVQRYRDWDNLQYLFRGIEKFTPWVNRVHFVTWGHLPKWLNLENPKLNIVKHEDFMPKDFLPTFNCNPLEINLHRIQGLEDKFVYFNDDTFLTRPLNRTDFFINGLPCDSAILNVHCYSEAVQFHFGYERAMGIINKYFCFHESIKSNWKKWITTKYGKNLLRTIVLLGCPRFPGLWQHHAPSSFLKSTYTELWEKEESELRETSVHKFRHKLDLTQASFKAWQIASGNFMPRKINSTISFMIQSDQNSVEQVVKAIKQQKYKMTTINDGEMSEEEFYVSRDMIKQAFESILPEKCSFEL